MIQYAQLQLNYRIFGWGVVLAVVFGLLSGVYPAWRMSRLHPVHGAEGSLAMIRHVFKLIWNRKRTNFLMMTEIFVSFLVLFAVVGARRLHRRQLAPADRLSRSIASGTSRST